MPSWIYYLSPFFMFCCSAIVFASAIDSCQVGGQCARFRDTRNSLPEELVMMKLRLGAALLLLCGTAFASAPSFRQPRLWTPLHSVPCQKTTGDIRNV